MKKEEVKFYVPFTANTFQVDVNLIELMKEYPYTFHDGYKIGALYGCFGGSIWNGGSRHSLQQVPSLYMSECAQYARNNNIPLRFTFTNRLLEEKHLYDTYSNVMLESCKLGDNEVLVACELMENYIKDNWKEYKVVKSTCWSDVVPYDDTDRFYMSVLNRKKNMDNDFLRSIENKNKVEIVLNEYCYEGCPLAFEHYDESSREALSFAVSSEYCNKHHSKDKKNIFVMKNIRENNSEFVSRERMTDILIPMGFRNFKIVGRSYSVLQLITDIAYYMVKPEYHDDIVIALSNGVIEDVQVI